MSAMNIDVMKGSWKELKGKVKEQWGKLTDNDLTEIEGEKDQLIGKLQQRYGHSRDQAEKEVNRFLDESGGSGSRSSGSSGN